MKEQKKEEEKEEEEDRQEKDKEENDKKDDKEEEKEKVQEPDTSVLRELEERKRKKAGQVEHRTDHNRQEQ